MSTRDGAPPTSRQERSSTIRRRFRCYDPQGAWPHRAFPVSAKTRCYRPAVAIPPTHKLVIAVRRFCREVANHDSLTLDTFDAHLVTDAARLVAVLMGGH